jgi:DNA polymerase III delta prime subunit
MTINQAKKIILEQIENQKSQTFLIEGSYKVGQLALAKTIIQNYNQDNSQDVFWVDKNAEKSSIGLSEIEIIKHHINQTPLYSKYNFFIINNADLLNKEAQNSLLKVIEEPGKNSIILLLSTYHQLLPTIYSRCLNLYLDPIDPITDLSLGHYDLQLEMNKDVDLYNTVEQIWLDYINFLQSDEIEIFNYVQKVNDYSMELFLFVLESIHFIISLAHTDNSSYTKIRLPKNLNKILDNIVPQINAQKNYKILKDLQSLKKTILFSNSKNILAIEKFLISNKIHI